MASTSSNIEARNRRNITLALLTTGPIDPNNRAIWAGVDAAGAMALTSGVNLICYPGRLVRSPVGFESQRNVIYRMLDEETVDGLIVMGGLNAWLTVEETFTFLQKFRPRPIVTTGIVLDGFPGVTVDNYHGMYEVISHLVIVHQRSRIAFIRGQAGHQEAGDRYQAYRAQAGHAHKQRFEPQGKGYILPDDGESSARMSHQPGKP